MDILLQNERTTRYVQATSGWTRDRDKARRFLTGLDAMFFCFNHRVRNMRIVGEFPDTNMNFVLQVTDLRGG